MPVKIKVFSDFACPFCYLAEAPLKEAIKGESVEVEWMPFELRPLPHPTLSSKDPYIQQAWNGSVKPLAEQLGVKMLLPDMDPLPHTHYAHEGYQFAKTQDKETEYVEAVLKAFWENGLDIGKIDILATIAEGIGLSKQEFTDALTNRTFKQSHEQALQYAYGEANIKAVPTFFIGNRRVQGLHSATQLKEIIKQEANSSTQDLQGLACEPGKDFC
ncbi:DsbA family oxidoreductase [Mangrovibacillus cuniculi]|uniref:Thioredoxin domain-containing protein n=1 Tax=Mangrovibacillus cuniculi TaxID=2593652 RepID=A0A7S8HET3_9BACI|nr:DsbA family protein [Mangrovibacillus cuniculi]QPC45710.1 thioredoxin domain-containing protein [Mangrovibacillus cuniculi]